MLLVKKSSLRRSPRLKQSAFVFLRYTQIAAVDDSPAYRRQARNEQCTLSR